MVFKVIKKVSNIKKPLDESPGAFFTEVIMKYFNDINNRLFKEQEDGSVLEVFSGQRFTAINVYLVETLNVQRYITDSIMIFMGRIQDIQSMLWTASGGAYYQDLKKIEVLNSQIDRANAELKLI